MLNIKGLISKSILDEKGAVLVLVGCLLGLFLIILALVVDVGIAYQERRQLQTSVDSASLAAAQDLAEGKGKEIAKSTAWDYVKKNAQVDPDLINVHFPGPRTVEVKAKTTRNLFIARVFGEKETQVEAKATAKYGPATSVSNLVPFIVPYQLVQPHIGPENAFDYVLGEDRPLDPFYKEHMQNGDLVRYSITYINTNSTNESVKLVDTLPDNLVYIEGSASAEGNYNPYGRRIEWLFPEVGPGSGVTVTFDVSPIEKLPTNTAYAYINGGEKILSAKDNGHSAQKGFFWLCDFDDNSGGTPDYFKWIIDGYGEEVWIGKTPNGEGIKSALKSALELRIETDPKVVLPLYDYTESGGSIGRYNVVGFAEFVITGLSFEGNPKTISGYFTEGTITTGVGGEIPPDYYFGVDVVWLES